jgi:hypothetical protein
MSAVSVLDERVTTDAKTRAYLQRRVDTVCSACTKQGAVLKCASCRVAYYCNLACQRADWRVRHKAACRALQQQREEEEECEEE